MKIQIKDIQANPFRDIGRYPINREKVDALRKSIQKTGFWDNVVARKINGSVELAYGHHRLVALKEEFDADHEVDLIVRDLPDEDMIRIMANENMDEWANNASVTIETIRAVISAFAQDKITLPTAPAKALHAHALRIAPSYQTVTDLSLGGQDTKHAYTTGTIGQFLGWSASVIVSSMSILEIIEREHATDADFERVPLATAYEVCNVAKAVLKEHGDEKLARKIIKDATAMSRDYGTSSKRLRDETRKMVADAKGARLPDITRFSEKLCAELHNYLAKEKQLANKLDDLLESVGHMPADNLRDVIDSFEALSQTAADWAARFRKHQTSTVVPLKEIS